MKINSHTYIHIYYTQNIIFIYLQYTLVINLFLICQFIFIANAKALVGIAMLHSKSLDMQVLLCFLSPIYLSAAYHTRYPFEFN